MDTNKTNENLKNAYADKFEAQLRSFGADLDKLKAQAQGASADLRVKLNEQIDDFQTKQQVARAKFEEYKAASADRLDALKGGLEKAWDDLRHSMDRAKS